MKPFYPIISFFILFVFFAGLKKASAQDCSDLTFSYTAKESRCMATGSVLVNASGGSGSYNYKVTGPVSTSFTSSNDITGLEPGVYELIVKDVNTNCEEKRNITITGSYSDPKFGLSKTDVTCLGNDGTITADNLQFGRAPFSYQIIAPSPSNIGAANTSGHFTNLTPGEYAIQLQDSCGGIQVRRVTIEDYSWWFDQATGTKIDCDNAQITAILKDNKGNFNSSGSSFNGFEYRIVSPITTSWQSNRTITFAIGNSRSATIQAKDNCGNVYSATWSIPNNEKPSVGSVDIKDRSCTTFTATITNKENLNGVTIYSLVDGNGVLKAQNTLGEFTNRPYGDYCIRAYNACYDTTIERCFSANRIPPSVASSVNISNRTCSTFTASITGQANLTNPEYCLYDSTNAPIQTCNSTGEFTNVAYGSYYITIHDKGCVDTIFSRGFREGNPIPVLNPVTVTGSNCSGFNIQTNGGSNLFTNTGYCLYDSAGNRLLCNNTGIFTGVSPHGTYCIRAVTSCNDTTAPVCVSTVPPPPSVAASVQVSNKTCTTFTASITGKSNLTNPQYCLFDALDNPMLPCNDSGIYHNLPYGSYKITIKDGCVDTTIIRNFSASQPVPGISNTFGVSNKGCSTFTATITGSNLINPVYYLFDSVGNVVYNATGVFNNLPYGTYCAEIRDECGNVTTRRCQTVKIDKSITVNASKTCNYGFTTMQISFASTNNPYTIKIYHPNGSLVYNTSTNNATTTVTTLPVLPDSLKYKIVGSDQCSNADSVMVLPVAAQITRTITVQSKCPSSTWQNGSGDLSVNCTSNHYTVTPSIIKKDGSDYFAGYSSNTGTNYVFSDLEPATYIVQYTMQNCTGKQFDTVTISPYTFPNQSKSAVYQCNDNSFSLSAAVTGGVGPFEYEIIGSTPSAPSIVTPRQNSAVFNINNGTTYSLIRLRSIDACGNAALNDVSVLPLQNISAKSNSTCLFNNITVTVDTIPNATYKWYRKTTASDSVLLVENVAFNIAFLQQEQIGTYVCRVSVNNDCLVRLAYFNLSGDCGHVTLPEAIQLKGKTTGSGNQLNWSSSRNDHKEFILQRKAAGSGEFISIGNLKAMSVANNYVFVDNQLQIGTFVYRLKIISRQSTYYSNTVKLGLNLLHLQVYPNPVKNEVNIATNEQTGNEYEVQLINAAGQMIYKSQWKPRLQNTFNYKRGSKDVPGMYVLKVINRIDNSESIYKLLFE